MKEEPGRKSIPRASLHAYNENLARTFESSEFDAMSPDQLPGMIFGMGSKNQENVGPGARREPVQASAPQQPVQPPTLIGQSPQNSDELSLTQSLTQQSLGNLQVNLD